MRSRVNPRISMKQQLIGYCIKEDKKTILSEVAAENNIEIRFAGIDSAGEKVGYLAGIKGMEHSDVLPEKPPECEVLIMAGLKSTVMDRVLKSMREKDVRIDLKCAVTAVNQNWEMYRLIGELEKEHKAMNSCS